MLIRVIDNNYTYIVPFYLQQTQRILEKAQKKHKDRVNVSIRLNEVWK